MVRTPPPCPVTLCLQVIGGKWKPLLIFLTASGCNRFGALHRAIPGISRQTLTRQLRELEEDRILSRTVVQSRPARVEYHLTERGSTLLPVIHAMRDWGVHATPPAP